MTLNFPANPSTQNPSNTFSPTSTPFASTNGATYIYQDGGWISLRNPIGNPEIQLSPTASAGDRPLLLKTTANDSSETTETLPYSSGLTFDASTAKLDVEGTIQSSGGVLIDGPASGAGLTMNQSGGSRITMNAAGRKYFIASDDGSDRLNIGARISNDTADKTKIRLTSSNTTIYDVLYVESADNPLIRFVDSGSYQYQVGIANNNQFVVTKGGDSDAVINYNPVGSILSVVSTTSTFSGVVSAASFNGNLIKSGGNQTIGSTTGGTVNVYSSTSHALRMYKEGTTNIYGAFKITSLTANHAYTLPDKNGTVAMTSDIPSTTDFVKTTGAQTIGGEKTFSNQVDIKNNLIVGSGTGVEGGQLTLRAKDSTGTQVFLDVDANNGCRLASTKNSCSFTIGQIGGTGGNMNLYAGGARRLVILGSNGRVGINNASPTKTLHVGGDFALTGGSDFGGNLNCSARVQAAHMQLNPGTSSPSDSLVRISGDIGGNYAGFYGFDYAPTKVNKPTASGSQLVVGSRVTFSSVTTLNSANKLHAFEAVGLTNTLTSGPNVDEVVGFYSNVPATKPTNAGGASYEAYNIFVAGSAPSQIPSVNALHVKLQQPSDLNQYDSEGNPLSYSQTDAATIDTGLYRDANDNICFARNGTEVMKLGAGTGVGNLIEKINNLTSALTLLKAAANDSNTDDAGKFAAIVAALANF